MVSWFFVNNDFWCPKTAAQRKKRSELWLVDNPVAIKQTDRGKSAHCFSYGELIACEHSHQLSWNSCAEETAFSVMVGSLFMDIFVAINQTEAKACKILAMVSWLHVNTDFCCHETVVWSKKRLELWLVDYSWIFLLPQNRDALCFWLVQNMLLPWDLSGNVQ